MSTPYQIINIEQGSEEWLSLRKTKITATDASIIMGVSPWKTPLQLYNEKISEENKTITNEDIERGVSLEPIAREMFNLGTEHKMKPQVIVKDWAMASLDGINDLGEILEIKCPREKGQALAANGKIPDYYIPQLQHQMYVTGAQKVFYYSFDGIEGITIDVFRDDKFIEKMIKEEKKFYDNLMNRIPPEPSKGDFLERDDFLWQECAEQWKNTVEAIKNLEAQEEELRNSLISLCGDKNTRGCGITVSQYTRKGNVDYSLVPQLKGLDLDQYRKQPTIAWRLSCQ